MRFIYKASNIWRSIQGSQILRYAKQGYIPYMGSVYPCLDHRLYMA